MNRDGSAKPMTEAVSAKEHEDKNECDDVASDFDTGPRLVDWLARHVTSDSRALAWFSEPEAERRIAKAYRELLDGYAQDPSQILTTTRQVEPPGSHTGIVSVRDISFFSICAHHFLPFFGKATISYLPGTRILGIGKLVRLVQAYARRFAIQEDITKNVAEEMMRSGEVEGVLVTTSARHLCMCSRGPSDSNAETCATYSLGCFGQLVSPAALGFLGSLEPGKSHAE